MKIRKIHIKNYKMFKDVTIDFTDSNGNTLDIIVLAGINGSGKTSLLQLIQKLFSASLNVFKIQTELPIYKEETNTFLCDEIRLELDISEDEGVSIVSLIYKFKAMIDELDVDLFKTISSSLKWLGTPDPPKEQYIEFSYKLRKTERGFLIERNDFLLFGVLPKYELSKIFEILYFPANYTDVEKIKSNTGIGNIVYNTSFKDNVGRDGIVYPIDIFVHRKAIKNYIVESVKDKVLSNRDVFVKEAIEQAINDIKHLLKGISLKTKLVDINAGQPIFESFNGSKVSPDEFSGGEKQLYYKAVLFDTLRPQNSLILVDEPETSLHPTWQQEVLKLYKNIPGNNQVILATHSPHIIAATHPDNLFILHVNEEKKTVECFNAKDKGLHTRGSEPNDILDEVMGTPLRDNETQEKIDKLSDCLRLHPEACDTPEIRDLIRNLTEDLGKKDPFIMRLNHQLMMLKRKKQNQPA